ncbi:hypothetical protein [Leptolyngbya sp. PCC 6406]|uniref:hypothetical protein n=1 Tax=Leptolyngbya sp. PCC 6406 TaxID=1173264 RepID=UPI000317CC96|nr:hypothetical protein [Leptolyngbya sp. PCC 6406]
MARMYLYRSSGVDPATSLTTLINVQAAGDRAANIQAVAIAQDAIALPIPSRGDRPSCEN